MVEQQPSKLNTRVRFPSPAPAFAREAREGCHAVARLAAPKLEERRREGEGGHSRQRASTWQASTGLSQRSERRLKGRRRAGIRPSLQPAGGNSPEDARWKRKNCRFLGRQLGCSAIS